MDILLSRINNDLFMKIKYMNSFLNNRNVYWMRIIRLEYKIDYISWKMSVLENRQGDIELNVENKQLRLCCQRLKVFPSKVFYTNLTRLDLDNNPLTTLPESTLS